MHPSWRYFSTEKASLLTCVLRIVPHSAVKDAIDGWREVSLQIFKTSFDHQGHKASKFLFFLLQYWLVQYKKSITRTRSKSPNASQSDPTQVKYFFFFQMPPTNQPPPPPLLLTTHSPQPWAIKFVAKFRNRPNFYRVPTSPNFYNS